MMAITIKLPLLALGCLLAAANAAGNNGHKTSLEDIERDYSPNNYQSKVSSPTKFGFVPQRTAPSYAATKPKYQYAQTNYQVKKSTAKPVKYSSPHRPAAAIYQQQLAPAATNYQQQSYNTPSTYQTQYVPQDYQYAQPEYSAEPAQQYEQYDNVQYVTDNSIGQQPQYYYVQQYTAPSTAVESVVDPKGLQYVTYVPSYSAPTNSIPTDQKYVQQYYTNEADEQPQLPPVKTTVKYTTVSAGKGSAKQYLTYSKGAQYEVPSANVQYQPQQDVAVKREPKSLLDSYVPSIVQLQYLKQQGKLMTYTKF